MIQPAALSRDEAATYLGISTDTLDRLRADGRISAFKAGRRLVRFTRAELEAFMERECLALSTASSKSQPPPSGTSSGPKRDARADFQRAQQMNARLKGRLQPSS